MNDSDRNDQLVLLNDRLASALLDLITSGEAKAADLNVARQFLKDNNLSALLTNYEDPDEDAPHLKIADELARQLQEQDAFDEKSA